MTPTSVSPLTWQPTRSLIGGLHLRIADVNTHLTSQTTRSTALQALLYVIAGYDHTRHQYAGYVGISQALNSGRPWRSYTTWTRAISAFQTRRIALVTSDTHLNLDELHLLEARVIRCISAIGIHLFNTQVSAKEASIRLGERAPAIADLGDQLAQAIATHVYEGRTNPLTAPAFTKRESAIRCVLRAERALDTREVLQRLKTMGVSYHGQNPDFTCRRDLRLRESDTAGRLRVHSGHSRSGRAVYWPASMPRAEALARYEAAHPLRPAIGSATPQTALAPTAST